MTMTKTMTWNDYKKKVKSEDSVASQLIENAEAEADIIAEILQKRSDLGLSQRDLASLCDIPQSTVARIESCKIMPKLDTLIKILHKLGLTLTVTPISQPAEIAPAEIAPVKIAIKVV